MQRIIITPTFRPHFQYNRDFLVSYQALATDGRQVPVHFIVSREEEADLLALAQDFPELDVHVHAVEDLLARAGHDVSAVDLLGEVGKFCFQALKKLYALKVLPYDQALILDSESLLLRSVAVNDLFDEYFQDKVVYFSDLEHRKDSWYGSLSDAVTANAAKLMGIGYPRMYLLEYYGWFYEKRVVDAMFAAVAGDLLTAVRVQLGRQKAIFESILYYAFLTTDPERYGYRFVSVNELLREYLGETGYARYIRNFTGAWEALGVFEYLSKEVSAENVDALLRLFNDHRLRFYRSELLNNNREAQDQLLEGSDIVVLASSEHYKRMHQRVAVCLSGHARNYRQNLRLLRSFLRDSGADVFFHLWDTPDREYIARSLQPTSHMFQDQDEFIHSEEFVDIAAGAIRRERFTPENRDRGSACMFYGIWRANELKRDYERAQNFRYDIVVRVRLDVLSLDTLNDILDRVSAAQQGLEDTLYVPDMAQSVGLNDQLAAGSSETMDAYASAYWQLEAFAAKDYFNPEYFLLQHILAQGLTIRTFPFEYVLLRDESITLFQLDKFLTRTTSTWWSAPLPAIRPALLMDYFRAKARSVALVAELGLETPRVFRLRRSDGSLLGLELADRSLGFSGAEDDATSNFFLIISDDQDRTAIDLRPADLRLSDDGRGWTAAPDAGGVLRPDGVPGRRSAFFLGGTPDALTLEWRAGFWQGLDPREDGRKSQSPKAGRLFLAAGPAGPILCPPAAGVESFRLEAVPNELAERAHIGMVAAVRSGEAKPGESRLVTLAWKLLEGARVYDEYGMREFVNRTAVLARRTLRTGNGSQSTRVAAMADRVLAAVQRRS